MTGRVGTIRMAIVASIATVLALHLAAQQSGAPTENSQLVIHTESRQVAVDAVVRGKDGKTVSGLGPADFRVWVDGKPLPASDLSVVSGAPAAGESQQYLAFLFQVGNTDAGKAIVQAVSDFAGAYARPGLYMAVAKCIIQIQILQNFTSSASRIQRGAGEVLGPKDPAYIPSTITVITSRGVNPQGAAGSGASARFPPADASAAPGVFNPLMIQTMTKSPLADAIAALADGMMSIRGRKSLVVLSASTVQDSQLSTMIRSCNRANVAVYSSNSSLKSLISQSGGRLLSGSLTDDLSSIVDDEDRRYVLGFRPANAREGSCHTVRVAALREGLDVQARKGYCVTEAPDPLAGKVAGKELDAKLAAPVHGSAVASMELADFYAQPGIALVNLAMDIDLSKIQFAKLDGKQHAELSLVAQAYGPDGTVASRFSDEAPFDFATAQEADAFRGKPYHYSHQFRLPGGAYNIKVAFSAGERISGNAESPLKVEAWDGKRLTLSGIALSAEARKVQDLASDLDPSLIEGRKDLIANSVQVTPSADNKFHRSAPCYGYVEVYDPALGVENPPALNLKIRVLDRATRAAVQSGSLNASDCIRAGSAIAPVLINVPLASIPPGAYTLEVTAASPSGASAVRTADFEVVE